METAAQKLIIALDDLDFDETVALVELTKPYAKTFKVGLALFAAYGPAIVKEINARGVKVFLDLKLHDIPMQIKKTIENLLPLNPQFITVHASGGPQMLKEAADAVNSSDTMLLAVSILTSLDAHFYSAVGFSGSVLSGVMNLAEMAYSSGVRGLVASPHEAQALKQHFRNDCLVICPGVRRKDQATHDQSRVMSPADAIYAGADALVVGRPITKAKDIVLEAKAIYQEINNALSSEFLHA